MGPEGAVNIVYRRELAEASDAAALREQLVEDYTKRFASPYVAAQMGYIDEVIEPRETRPKVIASLEMLTNKRQQNPPKKHGSIPL